MKLSQSTRETNTPTVRRLDVGVDSPRFPGRDVASSTPVVVTADASVVTDTASHFSAVTSRSRAGDVVPLSPEISWLFIPPTVERPPTGSGLKVDPDDGTIPASPGADTAPDATFRGEILFDTGQSSDPALNDAAPSLPGTGTRTGDGTEYRTRTVGTDTTSEYITIATNTPARNYVSDGTTTAVVADVACNTAERRYVETNTISRVDVQGNTATIDGRSDVRRGEAVPLISRRARSMPPSLGQLTNQVTGTGSGTGSAEPGQVVAATNIPYDRTASTYQIDSREIVVPERGYGIRDNGHVILQVPVITAPRHLCACCRRAMDEQNRAESATSSTSKSGTEQMAVEEDRGRGLRESAAASVGVEESRAAVAHEERAVGTDDDVAAGGGTWSADRGVGTGSVWTDDRGTGDGTATTADAETWTPTVTTVDRSSGTKPLHLVCILEIFAVSL